MNADNLSKVLMIWSCEEEDPSGRFLSTHERQRAGRLASDVKDFGDTSTVFSSSEEQLIVDRARRLSLKIEGKYPIVSTARHLAQVQIPLVFIVALAILGGFLTDPIGPQGQINLLHFPLLALLIWNLAMYVWSSLRRLVLNVIKNGQAEWMLNGLSKFGLWFSHMRLRLFQHETPEEKQWIVSSLVRFYGSWSALTGKVMRLQIKSMLHWGAVGLALGVVSGMYLRGFVFEYRASWASTFLEPEQVHSILSMVLSPAAAILGVDFPSVQKMALLRSPGSENAAVWIHLWAITCMLVIVVPRVGLALFTGRKASTHVEGLSLPLHEPYFHRMLAQYRGDGVWVEVLPYQCQLDHSATERLEGFCLEMFGNSAYVQTRKPIPYGETDLRVQASSNVPLRVLIVFDVATTPEQEVHGVFLQDIQGQVENWAADASLLVFIHEGSYQKQTDQQRLRKRYQTWQRFTSGYRIEPLLFSTTVGVNDMLQQAITKLWSSRSQEVQ